MEVSIRTLIAKLQQYSYITHGQVLKCFALCGHSHWITSGKSILVFATCC